MGDTNQLIFVRKYASQLNALYLEVGSKNYGNTQDLRPLFVGMGDYLGIDIEDDLEVDMTLDLTKDFKKSMRSFMANDLE